MEAITETEGLMMYEQLCSGVLDGRNKRFVVPDLVGLTIGCFVGGHRVSENAHYIVEGNELVFHEAPFARPLMVRLALTSSMSAPDSIAKGLKSGESWSQKVLITGSGS